jgi:hypothetical protein
MKQSSKTVKIARENQTTRFVGFVLLGLSVLVAAWLVFRPSAQKLPTLLTLEDNWDLLETSAHELQNDAYLMSVAISTDTTNPYAITAEYHSAHVADKTIFVGIDRFNKVDATWVNIPPSSNEPQKQIQRNDWAIDSKEALSIFAKDEAINTCLASSKSTIQLSLHRTITESVIWSLWVMDCPKEGDAKMDYLNAQTGERTDPFGQ